MIGCVLPEIMYTPATHLLFIINIIIIIDLV